MKLVRYIELKRFLNQMTKWSKERTFKKFHSLGLIICLGASLVFMLFDINSKEHYFKMLILNLVFFESIFIAILVLLVILNYTVPFDAFVIKKDGCFYLLLQNKKEIKIRVRFPELLFLKEGMTGVAHVGLDNVLVGFSQLNSESNLLEDIVVPEQISADLFIKHFKDKLSAKEMEEWKQLRENNLPEVSVEDFINKILDKYSN